MTDETSPQLRQLVALLVEALDGFPTRRSPDWLTPAEVEDLTGLKQQKAQRDWLDRNRIGYFTAASGFPKVMRNLLKDRFATRSDFQSSSAIDRARGVITGDELTLRLERQFAMQQRRPDPRVEKRRLAEQKLAEKEVAHRKRVAEHRKSHDRR